jgi:5'(3')-deoxyribonucleotidase
MEHLTILQQKGKQLQMLTFKESFNEVIEAKLKLPKGEKVSKEITKLGKKKNVTAVITSKFNLYIDGVKLDKYRSLVDAEKAVKEFIKLMGA